MGPWLYVLLRDLFQVYSFLVIAWILVSWIPPLRTIPIMSVVGRLVEPYLSIFRRIIPPVIGIDFSPIVAYFVYRLIESMVFNQILPLALHLYGVQS